MDRPAPPDRHGLRRWRRRRQLRGATDAERRCRPPRRRPVPTVSLSLTLGATTAVAGASFTVGYDAGRVALLGSGAQAQCRLGSNDTLAVNDDDAGTLRVAFVPADPLQLQTLVLPTTLTCDFAENGGSVSVNDLRISSKAIGVINADPANAVVVAGDASQLDVH